MIVPCNVPPASIAAPSSATGAGHIPPPTVIALYSLMPLDWIIDYEQANHQTLFAMGKADAERALARR